MFAMNLNSHNQSPKLSLSEVVKLMYVGSRSRAFGIECWDGWVPKVQGSCTLAVSPFRLAVPRLPWPQKGKAGMAGFFEDSLFLTHCFVLALMALKQKSK